MDSSKSSDPPVPIQSASADTEIHSPAEDENVKRKYAVNFCHDNIVTPLLKKYIQPYVKTFYDDLVRSNNVDTQQPPKTLDTYNGVFLNYYSINNNHRFKSYTDWNYKVTGHVDFSKLFLFHWESKYTDFTDCDASAVLSIIQKMDVFPQTVRTDIENYRKQVRNPLAHYVKKDWNNNKFDEKFEIMKSLIRSTNLPEDEKKKNIDELEEWRQRKLIIAIVRQLPVSMNFKQGKTTGSDNIEATVHGFSRAQENKTTHRLTQTKPQECEPLTISSVSKGSIKLDLRADQAIFKTPKSFETAVRKLLEQVIVASGIGPDEVAVLDVDFILPESLTEEQIKVVSLAFRGSLPEKDARNEGESFKGMVESKRTPPLTDLEKAQLFYEEEVSLSESHGMTETSDTTRSLTESHIRFLKCVSVVFQVFPNILRKVMEASMISATTMYARIQNDKYLQKTLTADHHKSLHTLLHYGYEKLDTSLILKIITHTRTINPPTRGWSSTPLSSETDIGDDVQRLRILRSNYVHTVTSEVCESEFHEFFSAVNAICERMDKWLKCDKDESFKAILECRRKQPLIDLEKTHWMSKKERSLSEFFVADVGRKSFKVYKAQSVKNFIKQIEEHPMKQQKHPEPITLTFPEISNTEFVQIMNELREEINQGLIDIKVERFREGSLLVDIMVPTAILLNDKNLQEELNKFLRHLSNISIWKEVLNTVPMVTMIISECESYHKEGKVEIVNTDDKMYSPGCLQFDLLQSEKLLQTDPMKLFDTVVSNTDGNQIFPSNKPIVSVVEPGMKEEPQQETISPISLTFPEINNTELNQTTNELSDEISLGFVNMKVEKTIFGPETTKRGVGVATSECRSTMETRS